MPVIRDEQGNYHYLVSVSHEMSSIVDAIQPDVVNSLGTQPDILAAIGLHVKLRNGDALMPFWDALDNRATRRVNILMVGDSITEGVGTTSWSQRLPVALQTALRTKYGLSSAQSTRADVPVTNYSGLTTPGFVSNSVQLATYGLGSKALGLLSTHTASTYTFTGRHLRMWYAWASGFQTSTVVDITVDGGAAFEYTIPNGTPEGSGNYYDIPIAAYGNHTVTIKSKSDALPFILERLEVFENDADRDFGVHVYDGAHGGWGSNNFVPAAGAYGVRQWQAAAALDPVLTIVNVGTNDAAFATTPAQTRSYVETIVAQAGAAANGPHAVLVVIPHTSVRANDAGFTAKWEGIREALRSQAGGNVAVLDLNQFWPTLAVNDGKGVMHETGNLIVHPNAAGHALMAGVIATAIVRPSTTTDEDISAAFNLPGSKSAAALSSSFVPNGISGLNARLAASRRSPVKVLCLGSSTTEGIGASTPANRWVNQFARAAQAAYPSGVAMWEPPVVSLAAAATSVPTLPGVHVINGGVGGMTSANYVNATRQTQLTTLKPDIVLHMIGSNDQFLDVTPAAYQTNLANTIAAIDAALTVAPIHVILDSFNRADITAATAHPWSAYIAAMRDVAAAAPGNRVFVSSIAEWDAAQATGINPLDPLRLLKWRTNIDIHPSDAGHALIASLVARGLRLPPPRPASPPEVLDRFQRAALGNTETGQPWEAQLGTMTPSGGALKVTAGGNQVVTTGFSDCEVSALITHSGAAVGGIIAKSNDVNTRIGVFLNGPSNNVQLYRGTTVLLSSTGISLTSGREYFLKLSVSGDQVRVELDGALVLSHTLAAADVTAYETYTKHGVRCAATDATVAWRHFAVRRI